MALTAANPVVTKDEKIQSMPVKADQTIYEGAIVAALNTDGFLVPGADTLNFIFRGIALEGADTAGESDGDTEIKVLQTGRAKLLLDGAFTQADAGKTTVTIVDDEKVGLATATLNDVVCGLFLGFWPGDTSYGDILITGYAK